MESFLQKMIDGTGVTPTETCLNAFGEQFPEAVNPEWEAKGDNYEVVFHQHAVEYVADLHSTGTLLKYTMQLSFSLLPTIVQEMLSEKGEIMNAVLINEGNQISYEVIFRTPDLIRQVALFDQLGNLVKEKTL